MTVQPLSALLGHVAGTKMDRIDWVILFVAALAAPISVWVNIRWYRKSRSGDLPLDWQSFWLILLGAICMVAILGWYAFLFILPGKF